MTEVHLSMKKYSANGGNFVKFQHHASLKTCKLINKNNKSVAQLTNREALTVLCSVIKHAGSG